MDALSARHKEEIEQLTRESSEAMRQLQVDYEKQASDNAKRIISMEEVIQKLRMQTVVQDSFWRKKEQRSTEDVQKEVSLLQNNHENILKAHKLELARQERLLDAKQAKLHESETQILLMKRQITEMKIQMDAKKLNASEETKNLEKKLELMHDQLNQNNLVKTVLERRIQEASQDLQDRNEQIRRLQNELRQLTEEVDKLRNEKEALAAESPQKHSMRSSPSRYTDYSMRNSTRAENPSRADTLPRPMQEKDLKPEPKLSWEPVDDAGPRVIIDAGEELSPQKLVDMEEPSFDDRLFSRSVTENHAHTASPLGRISPIPPPVFDRVRKDLHHVIESHMDRIETLTNDLKRTKTLSDSV